MESLIGVLLYIGALSTQVTYTTQEIYSIEHDNQQTVNQVEDSPSQMSEATEILQSVDITPVGGDKIIVLDDPLF